MNLRQGFVLFIALVLYLVMGSTVFRSLENNTFEPNAPDVIDAVNDFKDFLMLNVSLGPWDVPADEWRERVNLAYFSYIDQMHHNVTIRNWTFYDSFFFSLTVITTIGYGNIAPVTTEGQLFCMFYALLGIPMAGILLAAIGDLFSVKLLAAHERSRQRSRHPRLALTFNTINYLIPGFILFLLLPACVFMALEEWTFLQSIYYAVITLTTIGFGDYIAGRHADEYQWAYKIGLMCWIVFGLGYLSMILNFIAKAMKSKHVKKIEKTVTKNLKSTQLAFNKEIAAFMRQLNDYYTNKVKMKAYVENATAKRQLPRTSSCPSMVHEHDQQLGFKRSASASSIIVTAADVEDMDGDHFVEQTESSANFIFELAMALAYNVGAEQADQEAIQDPDNSELRRSRRSSSIVHIVSSGMSFLNPSSARNSMRNKCHLENNLTSAFHNFQLDARKSNKGDNFGSVRSTKRKMSSSSLFDNYAFTPSLTGRRQSDCNVRAADIAARPVVMAAATESTASAVDQHGGGRPRSLSHPVEMDVGSSLLHELSASRLQDIQLANARKKCDWFIGTDKPTSTSGGGGGDSLLPPTTAVGGDGGIQLASPKVRRLSRVEVMGAVIEEERSDCGSATDSTSSSLDSSNCSSRETVVIDMDGIRSVDVVDPDQVPVTAIGKETAPHTHL